MTLLKTIFGSFLIALAFANTVNCAEDHPRSPKNQPNGMPIEIFVSPAGSIDGDGSAARPAVSLVQAQALARKALAASPQSEVTVTLAKGTWRLDSPLVYTAADGGGGNRMCTWRAAPGADVTISGGTILKGWKALPNGRFAAPLPAGPEPEQVVVNGRRAEPARSSGLWHVESLTRDATAPEGTGWRFTFAPPAHLPDPRTGALRLVTRRMWSACMGTVAAVDGQTAVLTPSTWFANQPGNCTPNMSPERLRCFVEGHPDLLTVPGTWAIDRQSSQILYLPLPGETIDSLEVVLPGATSLVMINGSAEAPVTSLRFERLHFAETAWRIPAWGCDDIQAGTLYLPKGAEREHVETAAISSRWWQHGGITGCSITKAGWNSLVINEGSRDLEFDHLTIGDGGAGGILVGSRDPLVDGDIRLTRNIRINNCTINRLALLNGGSVGIWIGIAKDCRIENNEVSDLPYTGISLGWKWDPSPTGAGGHQVLGNRIHHVMKDFCDGGAIYVLGYQPGSRMVGNQIHDIRRNPEAHASPVAGIYLDAGSLGWTIEENSITDMDDRPINLNFPGLNGDRSLPKDFSADSRITIRNNTLVAASDGTAAQKAPPYDQGMTLYGARPTADMVLEWRDNRILRNGVSAEAPNSSAKDTVPISIDNPALAWPVDAPAPLLSVPYYSATDIPEGGRAVFVVGSDKPSPVALPQTKAGEERSVLVPTENFRPGVESSGLIRFEIPAHGTTMSMTKPYAFTMVPCTKTAGTQASIQALAPLPSTSWSRMRTMGAKPDSNFSATLRMGYSPEGLHLLVEVQDQDHIQTRSAAEMYFEDSIQIAIDADKESPWLTDYSGPRKEGHRLFEYGFSLGSKDGAARSWCWTAFDEHIKAGPVKDITPVIARAGNTTSYFITLPWSAIGLEKAPSYGSAIGFALGINDVGGGSGGLNTLQLFGGIYGGKEPKALGKVWLR